MEISTAGIKKRSPNHQNCSLKPTVFLGLPHPNVVDEVHNEDSLHQ